MIDAPSPRFLSAMRGSHERRLRTTLGLWDAAGHLQPAGPLHAVNGTLSMDSSLASWRRLSAQMYVPPETAEGLVETATYNGEITVEMGVGFADGEEWTQVAQLRIEEFERTSSKSTRNFLAYDRAIRVQDFPFVTPYAPRDMAGNQLTTVAAIRDIITTAFPSNAPPAFIVDPTLDIAAVPPAETTFTGARWDAVVTLGQSIGAVVYNDELGRFVLAPQEVPDAPVWTVSGGDAGTLVEQVVESTRVDQYNAVGLTCEPPSGDGIFVYVVDNDPTSPTYYDGPFGRKPFMMRNDTITSVDAAIRAARSALVRKKSGARDMSISTVYQPLLQPRDVLAVRRIDSGLIESQVIDSIELPLTRSSMSMKSHIWTTEPEVIKAIKGGRRVI